jgi:hypothetical protein
MISDIGQFQSLPRRGLIPDFLRNWDLGSRHAVMVPQRDLDLVVRKWTRGLHYLLLGRMLPPSARIDVIHVPEFVANLVFKNIEPFAPIHVKPPGVSVMYADATEGDRSLTIYRFVMWSQYKVYAAVVDGPWEPPQ